VAVDIAEEDADDASALLFELGATSLEHRDATTLASVASGRAMLVAGFGEEETARTALDELPAAWSPRLEPVFGDAWRDEWKKHFEPFRLCDGIVIKPPWRTYQPRNGERVIELEPGRAFGTGLHETTILVADTLADHAAALRGSSLLDVGCGSGILTLVGLALGAETARAIDTDPDAIAVTRENAERNGLSGRVRADCTALEALGDRYGTIVANIEAATLVSLAPVLTARLAPEGRLVLSGILASDVVAGQMDDVRLAYGALAVEETRRKGEWTALVLRG
jgi:ribosomal protein L11 methyltransferase